MPRSQSSSVAKRSSPSTPSSSFRNPYSSVANSSPTLPSAPSLGQSVKEGFGLGVGSAVAHRVVASIFGAPTVNVSQSASSPSAPNQCDKERIAFENCMKTQSMDSFCGQQQLAYTNCIRITGPNQNQ